MMVGRFGKRSCKPGKQFRPCGVLTALFLLTTCMRERTHLIVPCEASQGDSVAKGCRHTMHRPIRGVSVVRMRSTAIQINWWGVLLWLKPSCNLVGSAARLEEGNCACKVQCAAVFDIGMPPSAKTQSLLLMCYLFSHVKHL
jgi:hypothetical protein